MRTPCNADDHIDRKTQCTHGEQVAPRAGAWPAREQGCADERVTQRHADVHGVKHERPAPQQRAAYMPVAHQVAQRGSGGAGQPAADATARVPKLGQREKHDAQNGQVAFGRTRQIGSTALARLIDGPVNDAHGNSAHGHDDQNHHQSQHGQKPAHGVLAAQCINVKTCCQQEQRRQCPAEGMLAPSGHGAQRGQQQYQKAANQPQVRQGGQGQSRQPRSTR